MQIFLYMSEKFNNFASTFFLWESYAVILQPKYLTHMKEKSSNAYLVGCYIWLVNTISRGPITRARIDEKWAHANENAYKQDCIPESNFHRWRRVIELMFDIKIKCNSRGEYYISEEDKSYNADMHRRLLTMMGVSSLLKDSKELRDKILFESVPSGETFLAPIIEALRDQCAIQMTYQGFGKPRPATFIVEPYCLKMFKQRWYVLAYSPDIDALRIYSLDRIHAIDPTTQKYKIPNDFDAEFYFRNAYGVTVLDKQQPEQIVISIAHDQADYLRTLPLHPSQKEIEPINGYPAFSFYLYPSDEFCQELFKYGSDLEVHEPESLRKYFAEDAKKVIEWYNLKK